MNEDPLHVCGRPLPLCSARDLHDETVAICENIHDNLATPQERRLLHAIEDELASRTRFDLEGSLRRVEYQDRLKGKRDGPEPA